MLFRYKWAHFKAKISKSRFCVIKDLETVTGSLTIMQNLKVAKEISLEARNAIFGIFDFPWDFGYFSGFKKLNKNGPLH